MHHTAIVTISVLISFFAAVQTYADASPEQLTITVTDQSGVSSVLTEPEFPAVGQEFIDTENRLAVTTPTFAVAVPIDHIISMVYSQSDEDTGSQNASPVFFVTYSFSDKKETIAGRVSLYRVVGQSDFGDYSLELKKVKSIVFNHPSAKESALSSGSKSGVHDAPETGNDTTPRYNAEIQLIDGSKLYLDDLQRFDSYYYEAYAPPGFINTASGTRYANARNIIFNYGDSKITLEFAKLKTLTFDSDGKSTIKLVNGKNKTIILSKEDGEAADGINGVRGALRYFIPLESITAVEFHLSSTE